MNNRVDISMKNVDGGGFNQNTVLYHKATGDKAQTKLTKKAFFLSTNLNEIK